MLVMGDESCSHLRYPALVEPKQFYFPNGVPSLE